jgi:branched-chain amino acid transport system permease protein
LANSNLAGLLNPRRRHLAAGAVLMVFLLLLPLGISSVTILNILILTLLYAGLSQAWNILGGYCGQISLGNALYFGIGAYTSTLLLTHLGASPWFGMVIGGSLAAALALLIGWPLFRLKGHYFVIATIVIAEGALLLFQSWPWVGGTLGIYIPFLGDSWVMLQFQTAKLPFYYVALGYAAILWLVTYTIDGGRLGHYWRAVKDNADAAQSLGVGIFASKMQAVAISAFFTGVGGAFYAQFVSYIDPESVMNFQISLLMTLPAVLGGLGTLWGPIVGAAVLIPISELTRSYIGGSGQGLDLIFYGSIIMVIALVKPEGIVGLWADIKRRRILSRTPLASRKVAP